MVKKYDYQDRLIRFAGEIILFTEKNSGINNLAHLKNQLIRSSSSAALNFGETQGANTNRDYINKASIVLKELKESYVSLKIMEYIEDGNSQRKKLTIECEELIKICRTIIKNKKQH